MKLYLGGYLDFYHPEKTNRLDVKVGQPTSLSLVLESIGIPIEEVHLFVVNGEIVELDGTIICDQDEVKLFSAVGGG